MVLILHIETAIETASICLAKDGVVIAWDSNNQQKDHAAWIHNAIKIMMNDLSYPLNSLSAVSVSAGPGSYTGLRVGMATAKGLCYTLKIPMITLNTLEIMAEAAKNKCEKEDKKTDLLVPMIDARRMEVFTAIYNSSLQNLLPPQAMVLDENSFFGWKNDHNMLIFGNGSEKCRNLLVHPNIFFENIYFDATDMVKPTHSNFLQVIFADLAYSEPFYTKGFYSPVKKS